MDGNQEQQGFNRELLNNLNIRDYKLSEYVFTEGDLPDETMFFIYKGEVLITKDRNNQQEEIARAKAGEFFGEIGLINNFPRTANAQVVAEPCKLILLNKDSFFLLTTISPDLLFIVFKNAVKRLSKANQVLSTLLAKYPEVNTNLKEPSDEVVKHYLKHNNIMDFINGIVTKSYVKGDYIFREGDVSNGTMYFICQGEIAIRKKIESREKTLTVMKEGEFFGEIALIQNVLRSASAVTNSFQLRLAPINKDLFKKICKYNPSFLFSLLKVMFFRLYVTENKATEIIDLYHL